MTGRIGHLDGRLNRAHPLMPAPIPHTSLVDDADADERARRQSLGVSRGEREAFGALYAERFERVYRLARRLTGRDEAFCLDVVQETFLRVAKSMPAMSTATDVDRWMIRVTHTAALDLLRCEERERGRRERCCGESDVCETSRDHAQERARWIAQQIATLDAEDAAMLRSRFVLGGTLKESGQAAGKTGAAAHGRIRRLLAMLRAAARGSEHE